MRTKSFVTPLRFLAELRIRPPGSGPDSSIYVLSVGSRLELECQLDRGDYSEPEDVNALDWMRGKLRIAHNWLRSLNSRILYHIWSRQHVYAIKGGRARPLDSPNVGHPSGG